jgi:hypothetical protein
LSGSQPRQVPTWTWNWPMAAETSGICAAVQASETMSRVAKLSLPSMTTPAPASSAAALRAVSRSGVSLKRTSGLSRFTASRATSTLGRPTSAVPNRIWRWRLSSETWSSSITLSHPTPAAARYWRAGQPIPPAPTSTTAESSSLRWPSPPISLRTRWRA